MPFELYQDKPRLAVPILDDVVTAKKWSDAWFQFDTPPEAGWWPTFAADALVPSVNMRYWNGEFWSQSISPHHPLDFIIEKKLVRTRYSHILWARRGPQWLDPERDRTGEPNE